MLNAERLQAKAVEQCLNHAKERVMGDLTVTAGGSLLQRDGFQMRHTYTQALTIWRKYGRFDIIVNAAGNMIGFIDHDKYLEAGDLPLSEKEAVDLVRREKLVPESAGFVEYKIAKPPSGQGKIGKAIFALSRPEQEYDLLEVEINGAKRAVISVRPRRAGGKDA